MMLNGYNVLIDNRITKKPKLQVSANFEYISDSYRNKINDELLQMFGSDEQIIVNETHRMMIVSSETCQKLVAYR